MISESHNSLIKIEKRIATLGQRLGVDIRDSKIWEKALCHSSAAVKDSLDSESNERLEFLGDSILNAVISAALFRRTEHFSEGELSKIRSKLVDEASLAEIARGIDLGDAILMSAGEERTGGRCRDALLADAFEAIVGAVFIDLGFVCCETMVLRLFQQKLAQSLRDYLKKDFKSALQEFTQSKFQARPVYHLNSLEGPDHALSFEVQVKFRNKVLGRGVGSSKKRASQNAAFVALDRLCKDPQLMDELAKEGAT